MSERISAQHDLYTEVKTVSHHVQLLITALVQDNDSPRDCKK